MAFDSCSKLKTCNTNHFASRVLKIVTVFDRSGTRYRVVDVLGFDSDRKCMSVILQSVQGNGENSTAFDPERGVVILCKGAETSILSRVSVYIKTL